MRRSASRADVSPKMPKSLGFRSRRKRRSNRLAKVAAVIVGAYALFALYFYYRATPIERGPTLRGNKAQKPPPPRARVALALPYVGPRLPPFFKAFARSCRNAEGAVDVLLLLSDPRAVPVEARTSVHHHTDRPPWLPNNVKFVEVGANRFARLHARIPYPRARQIYPGDDVIDDEREPLAAALRDAFVRNPRQLVEFKPAIGVVFQEYLKNYTHWAFGDFDVLMGNMNAFLDADELENFDVVSYGFGDSWRAYARGQWTHHKNMAFVNAAYAHCPFFGAAKLERRMTTGAHYESAEGCYSQALAASHVRFKIVTRHFSDATQKGDRDAAYLAEGEVRRCSGEEDDEGRHCRPLAPSTPRSTKSNQNRWERVQLLPVGAKRCMSWVNPAYQTCLGGGDYQTGDIVVLDADGAYKRKRGPPGGLEVPGAGFSVAAFFHVQEWKKKYRSFSVANAATSEALLGTRFGLIPVPPLVSLAVEDVVVQRLRDARSVEHCAFRACEGIASAFQRDDLRWARGGDEGLGAFMGFTEPGIGLVVVASLLKDDHEKKLVRAKANACGWKGPSIVVIAVADDASWRATLETFRPCARTVVLARVAEDDGGSTEKALANVGLESCPARRCLVLRGDERLSADAHDAIQRVDVAPGTTLILPEFRSASSPSTVDKLRTLVRKGEARAAPSNRCAGKTPALNSKAYEQWWGGVTGVVQTYAQTFVNADRALGWEAPGALVVLDSVDARGDRRLVREVEEHRGPGCYDGLLARALATQHADAFSVVPGAFAVAAPYVGAGADDDDNGLVLGRPRRKLQPSSEAFLPASEADKDKASCGCRPGKGGQPPTKSMRRAVKDYDAYLVRAVGARGDADDEARARGL